MLYSNNGFKPSVWGPYFWSFIHFQSMNSSGELWFHYLLQIIPCKSCRDHIAIHVGKMDRSDHLSMLSYTVALHDRVSTYCHCQSPVACGDTSVVVYTYLALNYHIDRDQSYRNFFASLGVTVPESTGRLEWAQWVFTNYHVGSYDSIDDMVTAFRNNFT